jgi:hypothetical protein
MRYPTVDTPNADLFAAGWNGHTWRLLPLGAGSGRQELSAVACLDRNDCIAVGASRDGVEGAAAESLIDRWNGSTWTEVNLSVLRMPGGSGVLTALACPTPTWCLAVGRGPSPQTLGGPTPSLALISANGVNGGWRPITTPPGDGLTGVSCISRALCLTVGSSLDGASLTEEPLMASFDGTWTPTVPRGLGQPDRLSAVRCPTARTCLAGGTVLLTITHQPA